MNSVTAEVESRTLDAAVSKASRTFEHLFADGTSWRIVHVVGHLLAADGETHVWHATVTADVDNGLELAEVSTGSDESGVGA